MIFPFVHFSKSYFYLAKITINKAKNHKDQGLINEFREAGFKMKVLLL